MLGKDTIFQQNDYLFNGLSMFEYYGITSKIAACKKKVEGQDRNVEDLHIYINNIRRSVAYWKTALNDFIA